MNKSKKKRITKAWAAEWSGPKQYKVAIQPLGEWCVLVDPTTNQYKVTHIPTGMCGYASDDLRKAEKILGIWSRCPKFTLATWTRSLSNRFQRARDKALRA